MLFFVGVVCIAKNNCSLIVGLARDFGFTWMFLTLLGKLILLKMLIFISFIAFY
jgi:hypothetical protein